MKKLLFLLFLFACSKSFTQNISFEETVKYIQKKITDEKKSIPPVNGAYNFTIEKTDINTNGGLNFYFTDLAGKSNSFYVNIYNLHKEPEVYGEALLFSTSEKNGYYIHCASLQSAQSLSKAFTHLKKVCIKEKDPFDN